MADRTAVQPLQAVLPLALPSYAFLLLAGKACLQACTVALSSSVSSSNCIHIVVICTFS